MDSYSWEGYNVARERIAAALPSVAVVSTAESGMSQFMQVGPGPAGQGARTAARGSTRRSPWAKRCSIRVLSA